MSSNNAFSTSRGAANESAGKENGAPDDTIKPGNSSSTRGIVQEDATYDKNQETRALARDLSCRLDAVDEIRTILVAAAQNLGVKLPRKALSDADMELLKPKEHAYDQTQVIDYLLEVYLLNEQVGYLFFTPREGRKLEYDKLPGYQCVFSWDLPVYDHNRLIMHELGYDSNGYVCRLPTGSSDASCHVCRLPTRSNTSYHVHERIFIAAEGAEPSPKWKEQIFGREWFIECVKNLDAAKLGVLHSQATNQFERARAHQFESGFADSWFPELMKRVVCRPEEQDHVACIWLQYHMRVFTCGGSPKIYTYAEEGVELVRAQGDLFSPISGKVMHIVERRFSFALKTTTAVDLPIFTLINLSDYVLPDSGIKSLARNQVHNSEEWKSLNIRPWIRGTGIAAFAFRIHSWCGIWARLWSKLLDEIDGVSGIELADILSHEARRKEMFDDAASEFALSEFHFTVLQLLRIAREWIQESVEDLRVLVKDLEVDYTDGKHCFLPGPLEFNRAATEAFRQTWESVTSNQQSLAKGLLSRIAKKEEEVKSLRDGLFNATSVAESTKATQLNHYILVFTVVTIFYLPLSFVAALFALGLFSSGGPGQKTAFITTIVAVAGSTYLFSGLLVWAVRKPKRREVFKMPWKYAKKLTESFVDRISQ